MEPNLDKLFSFIKKFYNLKKERGYKKVRELFPTFEIMKRNLKLNDDQLRSLLRQLEEEGKVERKVSQYYLKGDAPKKQKVIEEKHIPKPVKKQKVNTDIIKILILKIGMGIIGIIATSMSIFFTYLWFTNMLNVFLSLMLSICMVGFSVVSFESIILFKQNKQYFLIGAFSFLWIIVVLFSMSSTMAGQLQLEFQKVVIEDTSQLKDSNDILLYQDYSAQIKDYQIDLKGKRVEIGKLRDFISGISYDTTSDRSKYNTLSKKITKNNKEIKDLKQKIEKIQQKKEKLLKNDIKISVKKKMDFFTWLESLFGLSADIFKFVLYLFPALFIDLIAPASIAMVLFYKKKG